MSSAAVIGAVTPPHQLSRKRLQFADEEGAERRVSPEKRLASASCSSCGDECLAERFHASDGCEGPVVSLFLCDSCTECHFCAARMTRTDELVCMKPEGRVVCAECCFWCVPCGEHHRLSDGQEAFDHETGTQLCQWCCCHCERNSVATFDHPTSGRWYCAQCVRRGRVYSSELDGDNIDDADWAELVARVDDDDDDSDATIEYPHADDDDGDQ